MAAHFEVTEAAIHQWKGKVPTKRILAVATYTGNAVTPEEMLQDVHPSADTTEVSEAKPCTP